MTDFCAVMILGTGLLCSNPAPAARTATVTVCPQLPERDAAFQRQLATELRAQGAGPSTRAFVGDAVSAHRQRRACRAK